MGKKMKKALEKAREMIESTYIGTVSISEYQKVKDPTTKLTTSKEVTVLENQPCRLSFESISVAVQSESAATTAQTTKLFIAPDVTVNAGSKMTVTQNGITTAYTRSGEPAVYHTHQEIMLELFDSWT